MRVWSQVERGAYLNGVHESSHPHLSTKWVEPLLPLTQNSLPALHTAEKMLTWTLTLVLTDKSPSSSHWWVTFVWMTSFWSPLLLIERKWYIPGRAAGAVRADRCPCGHATALISEVALVWMEDFLLERSDNSCHLSEASVSQCG